MITLPAGQLDLLLSGNFNSHLRVQVVPSGGGVYNPEDHLLSGRISASIDQATANMTLEFDRSGGTTSLSPLVPESAWNENGPLLYPGNFITLDCCITEVGGTPGVYTSIFIGRIDSIDMPGRDRISVTCRDVGGYYALRVVRGPVPYGPGPIQDVLAEILEDWGGVSPAQLVTVGSPDFALRQTMYGETRLLELCRIIAQQRGWDFRYFVSTSKLTFYEPARAGATPVVTLSPNEYIDIQRLEISDADVRNQVEVWYGARTTRERVYVEDAASMLQHGPQFCRIVEDRSSLIDTLDEATVMAQAALADMKDPLADQQVHMPFFPVVELNDFHEYAANGDHYTAAQQWAISGYEHSFDRGWGTTTLSTRGQPLAAFRDYRRGRPRMVHVSLQSPPPGNYLSGNIAEEGAWWVTIADDSFPIV